MIRYDIQGRKAEAKAKNFFDIYRCFFSLIFFAITRCECDVRFLDLLYGNFRVAASFNVSLAEIDNFVTLHLQRTLQFQLTP